MSWSPAHRADPERKRQEARGSTRPSAPPQLSRGAWEPGVLLQPHGDGTALLQGEAETQGKAQLVTGKWDDFRHVRVRLSQETRRTERKGNGTSGSRAKPGGGRRTPHSRAPRSFWRFLFSRWLRPWGTLSRHSAEQRPPHPPGESVPGADTGPQQGSACSWGEEGGRPPSSFHQSL